MSRLLLTQILLLLCTCTMRGIRLSPQTRDYLIEAESFQKLGGWGIDNQAATIMGSPYLLAHGMGIPVQDAETRISVRKAGRYRLWVRTRDWTRPWGRQESPGQGGGQHSEQGFPLPRSRIARQGILH